MFETHIMKLVSPSELQPFALPGFPTHYGALADVTMVNPNEFDVHLVACSMANLTPEAAGLVPHDDVDLVMEPDMAYCEFHDTPAAHVPSFHFGCKPVTLPARSAQGPSRKRVVLREARFVDQNNDDVHYTADQLQTFYVDLVGLTKLSGCGPLAGAPNQWLEPEPVTEVDWIWARNIWAATDSHPPRETLSGTMKIVEWPPGNWFTMASGAPTAPVRLVGTLTGLPEGARVTFRLPYEDSVITEEYMIERGDDPCLGAPLNVDIAYKIANPPPAFSRVTVDYSDTACVSYLEENRVAHLDAAVFALEDYLHYATGEHMYEVQAAFINDVDLPVAENIDLRFSLDGLLSGSFEGVDRFTTPTQAWVYIEQEGREPIGLLAKINGDGVVAGDRTPFVFEQSGVDAEFNAKVTLFIYDEAYNIATIGPFDLAPSSEVKFDQGLAGGAPMIANDGSDTGCGCRLTAARGGDAPLSVPLTLLPLLFGVSLLRLRARCSTRGHS